VGHACLFAFDDWLHWYLWDMPACFIDDWLHCLFRCTGAYGTCFCTGTCGTCPYVQQAVDPGPQPPRASAARGKATLPPLMPTAAGGEPRPLPPVRGPAVHKPHGDPGDDFGGHAPVFRAPALRPAPARDADAPLSAAVFWAVSAVSFALHLAALVMCVHLLSAPENAAAATAWTVHSDHVAFHVPIRAGKVQVEDRISLGASGRFALIVSNSDPGRVRQAQTAPAALIVDAPVQFRQDAAFGTVTADVFRGPTTSTSAGSPEAGGAPALNVSALPSCSFSTRELESGNICVGPRGDPGSAGAPGAPGSVGPRGPRGYNGTVGPAGPSGGQGPAGSPGPAGASGVAGPAGPQGSQGQSGAPGLQGPAGPQGPQGQSGLPGPQGPSGPQGPAGEQGRSSVCCNSTDAEWMVGPEGPAGQEGPAGPQGVQGERGPTGPAGPAGSENSTVIEAGVVGLTEIDATAVQSRVTGACSGSQTMYAVRQDGTVLCRDSVPASGSVGSGEIDASEVQRRVHDSCPAGEFFTGIAASGAVSCGTGAAGGEATYSGSSVLVPVFNPERGSFEICVPTPESGKANKTTCLAMTSDNAIIPEPVSATTVAGGDADIAISADGNTVAGTVRYVASQPVAAWVISRVARDAEWVMYPVFLSPGSSIDSSSHSVALSADGRTLAITSEGGSTVPISGAAWVFARNVGGSWTQQSGTLTATSSIIAVGRMGVRSSLSDDGNTLVVGIAGASDWAPPTSGYHQTPANRKYGTAAATFVRSASSWVQWGSAIFEEGSSVSDVMVDISGDGTTMALGARLGSSSNCFVYSRGGSSWGLAGTFFPEFEFSGSVSLSQNGHKLVLAGAAGSGPFTPYYDNI
jgi:hypothetical protein